MLSVNRNEIAAIVFKKNSLSLINLGKIYFTLCETLNFVYSQL